MSFVQLEHAANALVAESFLFASGQADMDGMLATDITSSEYLPVIDGLPGSDTLWSI
jgi:hypothetical protein